MHTVHKFKILGSRQAIDLPIGAKVLSFHSMPDGELYIWVWLDKQQKFKRTHNFVCETTGGDAPLPINVDYIGTAWVGDLPYVWHLFEAKE